ncbi:MAG: ribonuclease HII [Erysipelotrichaceae bacterium]|jgi:ribonuclease HII|nr:ribonuclease HII [Bacilli bacterium]NLV28969.1 ribonuclease HII [Erysipelotrichaceae bacterium]HPY79991.1 ribonuclease HII [Bacilli bacterium]HQA56081.1 ribonuclease HII [Bacilli bacterium]
MPLDFEKTLYDQKVRLIVGCDEAGRGCLLGPVFAGAVILPMSFSSPLINDSKKLNAKQREEAFDLIMKEAIAFGVGSCTPEEIDDMNVLNASRVAMERALENMNHPYDLIITDFMKIPKAKRPVISLVHGDAKSLCVAAASIIAKVSRDRFCDDLDKKHPQYHIAQNKGYGTSSHLEALKKFGPVKGLHRFSYQPVKSCLIKKVTLF